MDVKFDFLPVNIESSGVSWGAMTLVKIWLSDLSELERDLSDVEESTALEQDIFILMAEAVEETR